jgi:hypothetical protein
MPSWPVQCTIPLERVDTCHGACCNMLHHAAAAVKCHGAIIDLEYYTTGNYHGHFMWQIQRLHAWKVFIHTICKVCMRNQMRPLPRMHAHRSSSRGPRLLKFSLLQLRYCNYYWQKSLQIMACQNICTCRAAPTPYLKEYMPCLNWRFLYREKLRPKHSLTKNHRSGRSGNSSMHRCIT